MLLCVRVRESVHVCDLRLEYTLRLVYMWLELPLSRTTFSPLSYNIGPSPSVPFH